MNYKIVSHGDYPDFLYVIKIPFNKEIADNYIELQNWCKENNAYLDEDEIIIEDDETMTIFKLTWG